MNRIMFALSALLISLIGSSQNPLLLKDVFPGNNTGTIQRIVKTSNYTFFNQDDDDADTDRSLFRTDGTNAGTIKLNLTYPGYISTKAELLTALGNKVVFAGDNFTNSGEIWASDGTQAGTVALEEFQPNSNRIPVVEINTMGSYAYYSVINKDAGNVNHAYLRRTDGTAAGTSLVYDFSAFTGVPQVVFLTPINNILYFIVYDQFGTGVDQLWRSDGTTAGTYMVYNFTLAHFVEGFLMQLGSNFYIMIGSIVGGVRQNTLWKSDGTAGGTAPLKLIGTGNTNTYPPFAAIGSTLYFAGVDGNGKELWQTDGTEGGTFRVTDINPGSGSSNPLSLTVLNNALYFSATDPTTGGELWKYSGGVASLVKDINPGAPGGGPSGLVVSNNSIIFNATNGVNGAELWITDGTAANTVMIADINPGAAGSIPNTLTRGNPVYFAANNGTNGFEVFKYDNNGDAIGGPNKYYVNDNSVSGDLLTLGTGSNSNNGSKLYPFATISYAITQVTEGDTIYVDAGTYAEQVTIDKGLAIIGAGQNLTSIINPGSPLVPPPGPFPEYALIQTTQNIGDVHISSLQTTNNPANEGHSILLQTGGSVKNCRIIDGGLGVYVRVESAIKSIVVENNFIQSSVFAVACQGSGLTASIFNNTLNLTNPSFSVGIWVGIDFGPVTKLTATGNSINNYVYRGIVGNSNNTVLSDNSILGTGQYAIENTASPAVATCNWYGSSDQFVVASKMSGAVNFSPWLVNGTDNDLSSIGFQPVPGSCAGRQLFYVNDNSLTGDVYTTAVGNNANNGSPSAPLATITMALTKAQAGDFILVDAGSYTEIVNITKDITILGAGKGVTILNGPAGPVTPFPNTSETGIIQTANGLVNVIIENLTVDGTASDEQHGIFIQGGGRVSNCELRYVNDGFYFQYLSEQQRTAIGNNNYVHHINYVGSLFAGNGLTATATNNVIDLNGASYGMGFIAGYGGNGNVASFTASNNSIINFNGFGMMIGSIQTAQVHNNSITRVTGNYIQNVHTVNVDASCNWYGTSDAAVIIPNMTGSVTNSPWLTSGTDTDVAIGFQPVANACNGRQNKFYVNDASQSGDVFTTALGNDANSGIPSAPLATIGAAFTKASAGDTIFVDAGYYQTSTDITLNKSITFLGTNYQISPKDPSNPLQLNPARFTESVVVNHKFIIAANDIRIKGFYLDPASKTQIQQTVTTNDFDNIEIEKNQFSITFNTTVINITGKQVSPLVTLNYIITDNWFVKDFGTGGTTISINAIDAVQINNNVFTTNNLSSNNARIQTGILVGGLTGDIVISNNNAYQQNFFINGISAKKTTISFNTADECVRFAFASSSNVNPNEVEITDNIITNPRSTGGPVISYVRNNGTNLSSPNIARIERNTITANGTGLAVVPQALIGPTLDLASANTQVYIRDNKLTITGDFSTQSGANNYVSAIRFLNNSRQVVVEGNEMEFTATNYGSNNKFGIGILHTGLQPGASFNFLNNKFSGFPTSVGIQGGGFFGQLPNGVTVNINNNSFTGDVMSINNGTTSQGVEASCNWYGSAAAQNFINKLTLSTVNIVPWLTNGTDNDPVTGFQPVPNSCDGYPTLITLNSSTNVTCNGAANGTIDITTSYGKAPFVYTWTKDGDANFVSNNEDLTSLAPGTYRLAITDGNGSNIYIIDENADGPGTIVVTITEPDVLSASASGDNNICFNGTIGSAAVVAEGGTAPYTYLWSNGATTDEITNLIAGIYSVTVTDANGCTTIASYEVTQPTQVTATIANNSTACSNIATVNTSGGTPAYTYLWSNGSASATISGVPVGVYNVTVTDANGCTTTASITLSVAEAFNPSASVTDITCFGANNGIIAVTNANGTAPFMFSKDGGVSFVNGSLPFSFTNLVPGIYNIAVKDVNGCTGFVEKTIIQPTQLTTAHTVQNTCAGLSTGSINVTVNGGSPAYSYSWTGLNGTYSSTQLNISNLAAGNYTLTVTDKNNCTIVVPVTVNPFPAIVIARTITDVACRGGATGSINITATGGTGSGFTYSWTGPVITSSEDLNNIAKGIYKIRVTDNGSGCIVDSTFTVNEPASSLALATVKTNATGCSSLGSITGTGSGGTAPYTYNLNGGIYSSSGLFTGLYAGSYTIGILDARGCTTTKVVAITDNGADEYEGTASNKNNTRTRAFSILIETNIYARIPTVADSLDWYKFTTAAIGNYTVTFSHPNPAIVFDVYSSTGTVPIAPVTGSTPTAKTYILTGGTLYYIKVFGALSYICYDLKVSYGGAARINNSQAPANETANTIKPVITAEILKAATYPNPHQGSFAISIESPEQGIVMIEMFAANGQLISERKVNVLKGKGNIVQYNNMHQTVLYYRVRIGKHIVTGKIIGPN